ncbi:hypothetical protein MSAN_02078700 [Mycena sanguinolenta]|uniref:Uncharacterized protein n=1 Tax=Mycena sanguinolenta TaxID=230812 RepID=A0A8H6XI62_9AGAR|nr:hypothetical protein MSAN_02078700 [Mycena sanguinolenta]
MIYILPRRSVGEPDIQPVVFVACQSTAPAPLDLIQSAPSIVDVNFFNMLSPSPRPLRLVASEYDAPWTMYRGIGTHAELGRVNSLPFPCSGGFTSRALSGLQYARTGAFIRIHAQVICRAAISMLARALRVHSALPLPPPLLVSHTTIALLTAIPTITVAPKSASWSPYTTAYDCTVKQLMDALTVNTPAATPVTPQLAGIFLGTMCEAFGCRAYAEMVESCWRSLECVLSQAVLLMKSALDVGTLEGL